MADIDSITRVKIRVIFICGRFLSRDGMDHVIRVSGEISIEKEPFDAGAA